MSADYGSQTINGVNSVGPSPASAAQAPIGWDRLTAANPGMFNDQIGTRQEQAVTATENTDARVVAQGSPGRSKTNQKMTFCRCVAGCAALAAGTITAGVFVAGAGTSIAQAAIAANGFGWVVD